MNENKGIRKEFLEKLNGELATLLSTLSMEELVLLEDATRHERKHRFVDKMVRLGRRLLNESPPNDCDEIPLYKMEDCKLQHNLAADIAMNEVMSEMMKRK